MAIKRVQIFSLILIVLLILLVSIFFSFNLFSDKFGGKFNSYLIENENYGFSLNTPQNWLAEENSSYSQEEIAQLLNSCQNNKTEGANIYVVGAYRFKDQKYLQGFEYAKSFSGDSPSGAILNITINCVPNNIRDKIADYSYGNLEIGGEKALSGLLSLVGSEKVEYYSLIHNNFQYRINEYVYISPEDKVAEESIRKNYQDTFNEIISSLRFTK